MSGLNSPQQPSAPSQAGEACLMKSCFLRGQLDAESSQETAAAARPGMHCTLQILHSRIARRLLHAACLRCDAMAHLVGR